VGALFYALFLGGLVLAWINVREGRGDRRGAVRLGVFLLVTSVAEWILDTDHTAGRAELMLFRLGVANSLFQAMVGFVVYLALEPYLRRRWPNVLIAWSRALTGQFRDPLVGREVLVGVAFGSTMFAMTVALFWGLGRVTDVDSAIDAAVTLRRTSAMVIRQAGSSVFAAILLCFLFFVLRVVLRQALLADAMVVLLFSAAGAFEAGTVGAVLGAATSLFLVVALRRFGMVALATYLFLTALFPLLRATLAWAGGSGVFLLLGLVTLGTYACYLAIGSPLARRGASHLGPLPH
jgi:serine/threonine-protein kinase